MIKLPVSQLQAGMKIAKDIILSDGRLLLLAGFYIKPLYLRALDAFKVKYVFVEEGEYSPIEELEEEKIYNHAAYVIKNAFKLLRNGENVSIDAIENSVNEILKKIIENETVMLQLTGIRDVDHYTYLHSVDVCIYSTIIGKKLGYSKGQLMTLGMGAILHDIGKCKVSSDIVHKPDKLTDDEFNQMKLHTVYGSDIIKASYQLNSKISNIAFQHHEKWDGSGYPLGICTNSINPFSRIVTLADVYDALTSDRVYKKKALPHVAAEYIKNQSGTLFDPYIVELFINSIAVYQEGTVVLLSTGELGSIIYGNSAGNSLDNKAENSSGNTADNTSGTTRQKVHVFSNKSGPPVLNPYIIDLNERRDIEIVEVFL